MARFRLKELLATRGLSQTEVARRAGVSFATVNRMCTNATVRVDLEVLERLGKVLGVEPGSIIKKG